jgi:hypothetical protein
MMDMNEKFDDEGGKKPSLVVAVGAKPRGFDPDEKLDDEAPAEAMGSDADGRFKESCQVLARMISSGRVDPDRLGKALLTAVRSAKDVISDEDDNGGMQ